MNPEKPHNPEEEMSSGSYFFGPEKLEDLLIHGEVTVEVEFDEDEEISIQEGQVLDIRTMSVAEKKAKGKKVRVMSIRGYDRPTTKMIRFELVEG